MLQDCMRMHASMWQATATASGAPHNYAAGQLCCRTTMLQDNHAAGLHAYARIDVASDRSIVGYQTSSLAVT